MSCPLSGGGGSTQLLTQKGVMVSEVRTHAEASEVPMSVRGIPLVVQDVVVWTHTHAEQLHTHVPKRVLSIPGRLNPDPDSYSQSKPSKPGPCDPDCVG